MLLGTWTRSPRSNRRSGCEISCDEFSVCDERKKMASLLEELVEAHGGLVRWNELYSVRAHLIQGGEFWGMTGHGNELTDVFCTARLHEQEVSHEPFNGPDLRSRYTADRVSIERTDGSEVDSLENPRASFASADPGTPWTDLQLVYFVGTSMWTYLT